MPMQALRLDCQYHSLFEHCLAVPAKDRFLLVKPAAHPVPNERCRIIDALLAKLGMGKFIDLTGSHSWPTFVDRLAMDIEGKVVAGLLLRVGLTQDREPGLMAGAAVEVSQVIVPDKITQIGRAHV